APLPVARQRDFRLEGMVDSLVPWLSRLEQAQPEELAHYHFRLIIPGFSPVDINDWILTARPHRSLTTDSRASSPESISLVGYLDVKREMNSRIDQQFASDLAADFTLALGR